MFPLETPLKHDTFHSSIRFSFYFLFFHLSNWEFVQGSVAKTPLVVRVETKKQKATGCEVQDRNSAAKTFTFRELATATKNFRQECLLGEGGFGRVYKGTLRASEQVFLIIRTPTFFFLHLSLLFFSFQWIISFSAINVLCRWWQWSNLTEMDCMVTRNFLWMFQCSVSSTMKIWSIS